MSAIWVGRCLVAKAMARNCVSIWRRRQRPATIKSGIAYIRTKLPCISHAVKCFARHFYYRTSIVFSLFKYWVGISCVCVAGEADANDENRYRPEKIVFMVQLNYQFSLTYFWRRMLSSHPQRAIPTHTHTLASHFSIIVCGVAACYFVIFPVWTEKVSECLLDWGWETGRDNGGTVDENWENMYT